MKILYVEDTLLNLCLVERIARMGNHDVINYASAETVLRNFEQDKPDLVLVDIRLEGEMSGVELIQRLRTAGHQQPIAVITAITTDEMRERCLLVGANDYFTKPIAVRDLLHLIQRHEKTIKDQTKELAPVEVQAATSSAETKPETPPSTAEQATETKLETPPSRAEQATETRSEALPGQPDSAAAPNDQPVAAV